MKKIIFIIILLCLSNRYTAQIIQSKTNPDELYSLLEDASRLISADIDKSNAITDEIFQLIKSKSITDEYILGSANLLKGQILFTKNNPEKALLFVENALNYFSESNDENLYVTLDLLGYIYLNLSMFDKVISSQRKLLKYHLNQNNSESSAFVLSKIARAYDEKLDFKSAISNYEKALNYFEIASAKQETANTLFNLAGSYNNYGDFDKAVLNIDKAIALAKSDNFSHLLHKYIDRRNFILQNKSKALKNTTQLQVDEKIYLGNELKAEKIKSALTLAEIELLSEEKQLIELKIKAQQDDYEKEILNQKLEKIALEQEIQFQSLENENLSLALLNEQILTEKKSIENQKLYTALLALLTIIFLIGFLFYQQTRANKKLAIKNNKILAQKIIIEQKTKAINESLIYAKNIQKAILSNQIDLKNFYPESFVFLSPKDEVSGDFFVSYFLNNKHIVIAADCTGHGVPAAFMSIVLKTILDDIILKESVTTPDLILKMVCENLLYKINSNKENHFSITDGMDVCIIVIDSTNKELTYAGARNGFYLVRNGELTVYKGTRKSIIPTNDKLYLSSFDSHKFKLEPNDSIYLFSDGFMDQKGGPSGLKYFHPPFRSLIKKISSKKFSVQKELLAKEFLEWKNTFDQVDDVLVIGIKITQTSILR